MSLTNETLEEIRDRLSGELHVLVIMISRAWGGLEQTALADVRLLMQSGFHVSLLVHENSPIDHAVKMESPQIKLVYCPENVRNYFDGGLWRQLRHLIDDEGINLVHCHQTSILGAVVPALVRRPHVALVVSRHILNSHNKKDPFHALLYRRVDYMLVLSQTMRRNLASTFPLPEKKLRIVNLAIDLERFNPNTVDRHQMRELWGIPQDAFLVGLVGRLDPMKGQDLMVKAVAQAKKSYADVYGVMVGNETPGLEGRYLKELQESIRQLHLENCILLHGARKEVPEVMAALDLFVMPSWSEAFGLVALEAMAMGVPCILGRGGSAEEMAAGSGAELVRPQDAYDLARKIILLRNSPTMREEMRQKGRAYVIERHSKNVRLQKTLEVYGRCYRRRIYDDPHHGH
ncbi:MAG TPA: glycosyltransferase family 4 protein [Bdellovibrionota bacterium]|jgi:glycosyltransferase involved in cell wall biosynthesis